MPTNLIKRLLFEVISGKLTQKKAIVVLGPRQTGKTTLLRQISSTFQQPILWLNCDDPSVRDQLENATLATLKRIIGTNQILIIDEAQRVKNIGLTLKLIIDELSHVKLLVSGSSAFEIANEINEPLTGRKWEYYLFPISWEEYVNHAGYMSAHQQLETRLLYGMYPDVITSPGEEKEVLAQLTTSYLYKDLLSYRGIRKPELLDKLLKALALQIGQEVSYNELAGLLQVDKSTVSDYIRLLEQAFIITRLQPLSRNLRNEISTMRKIYFWDTGVRNMLIGNFNSLQSRTDAGALWENFLVVERMKYFQYHGLVGNRYFWRTKTQQEIDYVEERDGKLYAFEFKLNPAKKFKFPKSFTEAYPNASTKVISPEQLEAFIL